jgi:hypothetical protein
VRRRLAPALIGLIVVGGAGYGARSGDGRASGLQQGRLIEPPASVTSACRSVAARARDQRVPLTVYCPPTVANVLPIELEVACGLRRCAQFRDGYMISFWSPTARRADRWGGHWSFGAGSAAATLAYLQPGRVERLEISGRKVRLVFIAPEVHAFYAGHVVAVWRQAGLTFHMTVHGFRWASRLRLMVATLIEKIRLCSPRTAAVPRACATFVFRSPSRAAA